MATQKLTERQQEIKALLDQGKTPGEVANALGITENAVYQHRTRIRTAMNGGGGKKPAAKSATRKRGGAKRSDEGTRVRAAAARAATPARPKPEPVAATPPPARPVTPLQAVRARKAEIETELSESTRAVAVAQSALKRAQEVHQAAVAKRREELVQLTNAENALRGVKKARKPAASTVPVSSNSGTSAPAEATVTVAPAETAPAEDKVAAALAPQAQPAMSAVGFDPADDFGEE